MKNILVIGDKGFLGRATFTYLNAEFNLIPYSKFSLSKIPERSQFMKVLEIASPEVVLFLAGNRITHGATDEQIIENYTKNVVFQEIVISSVATYGLSKFIYASTSAVYDKFREELLVEELLFREEKWQSIQKDYAGAKDEGMRLVNHNYKKTGGFTNIIVSNVYGGHDLAARTAQLFIPHAIDSIYTGRIKNQNVFFNGNPETRRDFLHEKDFTSALRNVIMQSEFQNSYNIGSGCSHKVSEIANIISNLFGFENQIVFREFQDELTSRRVMNVERMRRTGWVPTVSLSDGITETVSHFLSRLNENK
jgi:GDP-L-fucose synthase